MRSKIWLSRMVLVGLASLVIALPALAASGEKKAWPKEISIAGTFAGGGAQTVAIAIAAMITKYVPGVKATAEPTAGPVESAKLLGAKEAEIAFSTGPTAYMAVHGLYNFKDRKLSPASGVSELAN